MKHLIFKYGLNKVINLEESCFINLIIENIKLRNIYFMQCANTFIGTNDFWDCEDNTKNEFCDIVDINNDLFNLEINTKKNINSLYKILKKQYHEVFKSGFENINVIVQKIIKEIQMDYELRIESSLMLDEDNLFKGLNIKFDEESINLKDKLIKYIKIIHNLRGINLFHFLNLHIFFNNNEIEDIFKELSYEKITIINIEFVKPNTNVFEQSLIIDNDLCVY